VWDRYLALKTGNAADKLVLAAARDPPRFQSELLICQTV